MELAPRTYSAGKHASLDSEHTNLDNCRYHYQSGLSRSADAAAADPVRKSRATAASGATAAHNPAVALVHLLAARLLGLSLLTDSRAAAARCTIGGHSLLPRLPRSIKLSDWARGAAAGEAGLARLHPSAAAVAAAVVTCKETPPPSSSSRGAMPDMHTQLRDRPPGAALVQRARHLGWSRLILVPWYSVETPGISCPVKDFAGWAQ